MYRFCPIVLLLLLVFSGILPVYTQAAVIVIPCSGICLNNAPGIYRIVGNITIRENLASDLSTQSGATLILTVPAGFEFMAGTGTVNYQNGRDITAASIVVTSTTVTVTYSCSGTNKADRLVISSLRARGTMPGSAASILRTGGTANIAGNAAGAGVIHGRLSSDGTGVTATSIANGNWSNTAIWSTGVVPKCNQEVIINHTVAADIISNNNNLIINSTGYLIANFAISVSDTFRIAGGGTYVHNNNDDEGSTIFAGIEDFSTTSNFIVNQWSDLSIPLAFDVSSTFGNLTFNQGSTWNQNGMFSPAKILGNIIVNSGTLIMDDGTGMTTSLALQDVTINGSANIRFCSGTNRNFTLTTKNYSDLGTGADLTTMMYSCVGTFQWTANGNVILNDNFHMMDNSGSPASVSMNVTGNLSITGGNIHFMDLTSAPLSITVNGTTSISGSPGFVKLASSGTGAVIFNTGALLLTTGTTIEFLSGTFSGTNQFNITGNLEISGASTFLRFINRTIYTYDLNLTVGVDILIADADVNFANTNGEVSIYCGRNMNISGSTSVIYLQERSTNNDTVKLTVSGTLSITNALYKQTVGEGYVVLTVGETFQLDGAEFYGVIKNTAPSTASGSFTFQDFNFLGGFVQFVDVKTNGPTAVIVNCTNNFNINWSANTDAITIISYKGSNEASLNFTVGGNFTVSGNFPSAAFVSSHAEYGEIVNITGNFTVSGGKVFFVSDEGSGGTNGHNITMAIGNNIEISGGFTNLSSKAGSADITVGGDVIISGGTLNQKWNTGIATMTVSGKFLQSGGTFNVHSNTSATTDTSNVIVYDDFIQSAGTFNFDNAPGAAMAEHKLILYGDNHTLSGSAVITHANNLSGNYIFGQIYFSRAGITTYARNSTTHNIQHVKQTIQAGTTVDASASTNGFQMTSVASNNVTIRNALTINGTLDMGNKVLSARSAASYNSRLSVNGGARYRTSHTGGLYSGSNVTASSINGYILTLNNVGYYLAATSIVEYYGTSTSVVTGIPNGIATTANQQYGILQINFTGTAGSTWVYPETTNEIYIRNSLLLTAGEFNLDSDHVTSGGGRSINVESGATITRVNGFIRSETEDGSGVVKWNINTNSTNVIPFGYDAANYIPFTFQQTSGNAGIVQLGTYRTITNNTPYPPTVTHVRDVNGIDNSLSTVDRFWNITVPGTTSANLTFSFVASEGSGIVSPRAQRWEPVTAGWNPPAGVQSNTTSTTTLATGITAFNTWWTLSSLGSALPIELASFNVDHSGTSAIISWVTASEINNDYFNVERSADGVIFESINRIHGAGTSSTPLHYAINDDNPFTGINYYRLKQTDYDGHFTYSDIKTISFIKTGIFKVYPNPSNVNTAITVEFPEVGVYEIKIADFSGKIIFNTTTISGDDMQFHMYPEAFQMKGGLYLLSLTGPNSSYNQKLLLQN